MDRPRPNNPLSTIALVAARAILEPLGYDLDLCALKRPQETSLDMIGTGPISKPDGTKANQWTVRLCEVAGVLMVTIKIDGQRPIDEPVSLAARPLLEPGDRALNVVFAPIPGGPDLRFVEIEDDHGRSISAGKWHTRSDGRRSIRIKR